MNINPHNFHKTLNIKGKIYSFDGVMIMGILNVTPDSFFDGGKYESEEAIISRIHKMVSEGADIIDVGGQSTRPGAVYIEEEEELARVIPAILRIKELYPDILISIDTFRAKIAESAIKSGAHIVNDVSCGSLDLKMIETVAGLNVPYIAMHSRGNAQNMSQLNDYKNITKEVLQFFAYKIRELNQAGIHDIIVDPGFGFAKNVSQNYELLRNIEYLHLLDKPVLVGISRKSMIYKTLGISADGATNGTSVLNTFSVLHGANILRVHDVQEAKQVVGLCKNF